MVVRWYRDRIERMGTKENLEQVNAALSQPNPRLHLYTLVRKHYRPPTVGSSALAEFEELQRQIAAAKAGG